MCNQVNKLLLCTCEFGDDYPDEFWILHRYNKDKNEFVVGEPYMPSQGLELLQYNKASAQILKALNEHCPFDKEIILKEKDVLSLMLNAFEDSFDFRYNGKKWVKYRNKQSFELVNEYDEIKQGIIKADLSAFLK